MPTVPFDMGVLFAARTVSAGGGFSIADPEGPVRSAEGASDMDFTGSVRFAGVTYDFQLPEHVLRDNGWFSSHNVISHPFAEED